MKAIEDRRVRRTRSALSVALVELILERGFHAVTVEQIVDRADVGRATFYAHYRDKEDLLVGVARNLIEQVNLPYGQAADEAASPVGLPLLSLFQHAERERPAYQVILRGEGDGRTLREFTDALSDVMEYAFQRHYEASGRVPCVPLDVMARARTSEVLGVLGWWLEGGTGYSAADVTRALRTYWEDGHKAQQFDSSH